MLYAFFWVIPRRLNSDAGQLPRRKHITDHSGSMMFRSGDYAGQWRC